MLRAIASLRQLRSFAQNAVAVMERAPCRVVVARRRRLGERIGEAEGRVLVKVVDEKSAAATGRGFAVVGEEATKVRWDG